MIHNRNMQIIITSSLADSYEKWTETIACTSYVKRVVTALWSSRELFMTGCGDSFIIREVC